MVRSNPTSATWSSLTRVSPTTARCGIRRPPRHSPRSNPMRPPLPTNRKERADGRRRTPHDHGARGVRGLRGGLEGLEHPAHSPDVGCERDPRHHPRRRDHRRRPGGRPRHARPRAPRRGARGRKPRGRLRRHRPHAGDVPQPEGVRSMTILSPTWTGILYLLAAVCFILALKGLSSPKTARRGNLIGATGALIAVVTVFLSSKLDKIPWILAAIAVGAGVAAPVARRVQMTQMPQLVAIFNGVGGGAAALVALLELGHASGPAADATSGLDDVTVTVTVNLVFLVAIVFTLFVGALSFAGSL